MNLKHEAVKMVLNIQDEDIDKTLRMLYESNQHETNEDIVLWDNFKKSTNADILLLIEAYEYNLSRIWDKALDLALISVDVEFQPMGWLAEQHMSHEFEEFEDYYLHIDTDKIEEHKKLINQ